MGQSAWAVSTVLAAFMAGLGAGAIGGGTLIAHASPRRALVLYAAAEALIACCGLATPIAVKTATPLLAFAYAGSGVGFAAVRLAAALVVMTVPAAMMGATFPIAARAALDGSSRPASIAGALYAANTAGACGGAFLAGFVLVPALGLRLTSFAAVLLNIVAAAIAIGIARKVETHATDPARPPKTVRQAEREKPRLGLAASALAVTGFMALINEVAWTRVLALTIGPTTYAFSAMLGLFILGLAMGSALGTRLVSRTRDPDAFLGLVVLAGAAVTLWGIHRVDALPLEVADLVRGSTAGFGSVMRAEVLMWAMVLLPIAVVFGAAFPIALRIGTGAANEAPRAAGVLFAANTVGSLAGSLAAGFLLVPALGIQRTIEGSALALAAFAIVPVARGDRRLSRALVAVALAGGIAVALRAPRWDAALLASGAYKYAPYVRGPDLESALRAGTLLYYKDGAAGTVSVRRIAGVRTLAIDGKVDASNGGDMITQKLLGHLPLMLHARPRRVAIVGLGSGVTLGAALRHPIERADTIEISPEVVAASRLFAAENHQALDDPRAHLIIGDGRSHLMLSSARYDVIVSEPSNPWMAGVATLFTREFFLAARKALNDDGILCQWAHTYDISADDLRSIAATFASVFPEGTIWLVGPGDLLLIGSPSPIVARVPQLQASYKRPGVAADLKEVLISDASSLLAMYAGGPNELRRYSAGAAIQTDDRTALEFSAPRDIFRADRDNTTTLRGLADVSQLPPLVAAAKSISEPAAWRERGRLERAAEAYSAAYDAFKRAVIGNPDDQSAIDGFVDASAGAEQETIEVLKQLADRHRPGVAIRVGLSRLFAATGDPGAALEQVVPLIASMPDDPRPAEQAASVLADAGDAERLRPLAEHLRQRWPERADGTYFVATAAFLEGRPDEAERLARDGIRVSTGDARFQTLLGAASAGLGRRDAARSAFEEAVKLSPRDATAYTNLGQLDLDSGSPESAALWFAEALILSPNSPPATRGLAQALRESGHPDRAARVERR